MCDCYDHKCYECEEQVPMHIADFDYPRSDFKVWCPEHIALSAPTATIFRVASDDDPDFPLGYTCAIDGPQVGVMGGNHPNIGADVEEIRGFFSN